MNNQYCVVVAYNGIEYLEEAVTALLEKDDRWMPVGSPVYIASTGAWHQAMFLSRGV